jgi:dTDP-4-dehydrorhamnose 3,5-epimerase
MTFIELELPGLFLIEPVVHGDDRGAFRRHFCMAEFAAHGLAPTVVQGNISENVHAGTLRGIHYQVAPFAEAKTLSCLAGTIYDVTVDLRPASSTFLRWVSTELSAENRRSLHVPAGCANGWITLAPHTIIHYYMSEKFDPASARGIRYDDPRFDFRWPLAPTVISDRDRTFPDFDPAGLPPFPTGDRARRR